MNKFFSSPCLFVAIPSWISLILIATERRCLWTQSRATFRCCRNLFLFRVGGKGRGEGKAVTHAIQSVDLRSDPQPILKSN